MRSIGKTLALSGSLLAIAILARPQKNEMTDGEYTAKALSAAPTSVADAAAVVRVQNDGSMKTIREGKNGFTCLVMGTDKMCNDANSMEFIHALMNKQAPRTRLGFPTCWRVMKVRVIPTRTPPEKRPTTIGS
jgi:hypothetical protein